MKPLAPAFCVLALAACSAEVQRAESANFAPVYPVPKVAPTGLMPTGGIYAGTGEGLFVSDRRANEVGDILTVDFTEDFRAAKSLSASGSRDSSFSVDLPSLLTGPFDDAKLSSGSAQSYGGAGAAAQSNSFEGRVSVSVVRKLPGGLLEIMGQRKLSMNNGDEYVRLTGVVRQTDVSADNVIPSDRIANAEITYVGAGHATDAARPGWLMRGLSALSPL